MRTNTSEYSPFMNFALNINQDHLNINQDQASEDPGPGKMRPTELDTRKYSILQLVDVSSLESFLVAFHSKYLWSFPRLRYYRGKHAQLQLQYYQL